MDDENLAQAWDAILDCLNRGDAAGVEAILVHASDDRARLERLIAGLRAIGQPSEAFEPVLPGDGRAEEDSLGEGWRLGDYRIQACIGAGGMGKVFRAEHIPSGRVVALKVLPAPIASPEDLDRFRREAELATRLSHPAIVPVYGIERAREHVFYTMDYVPGRSLKDILGDLHGGTVPSELRRVVWEQQCDGPRGSPRRPSVRGEAYVRWVADVGRHMADALEHAHAQGIIHRDIKPSNILIDQGGRALLCDFGLARDLMTSYSLTAPGTIVGTPAYMSPEQIERGTEAVDQRTDVYSLSLTMYEALAARQPFLGETTRATLAHILETDAPRLRRLNPAVPPDLEAVIFKGMQKDRRHRHRSARALADDLRSFLEGKPVAAPRVTFLRQAAAWARRRKAEVAALCLFCILLAWLVVPALARLPARIAQRNRAQAVERALTEAAQHYASGDLVRCGAIAREQLSVLRSDLLEPALQAQAEFLLGASLYGTHGSDTSQATQHVANAMCLESGTEWPVRARLLFIEKQFEEGNRAPADRWLDALERDVLQAVQAGGGAARASWQGLLAAQKLLSAKVGLAGWFGQAPAKAARAGDGGEDALTRSRRLLAEAAAIESPCRSEAAALCALVEGDFVRTVRPPPVEGYVRGISSVDVDGAAPPEIILLTPRRVGLYHLVADAASEVPARPALALEPSGCAPHPLEAAPNEEFHAVVGGDIDGDGRDELVVSVQIQREGILERCHEIRVLDLDEEKELRRVATLSFLKGELLPAAVAVAPLFSPPASDLVLGLWYGEDQGIQVWGYDAAERTMSLRHNVPDFRGKVNGLHVADVLANDGRNELIVATTGAGSPRYGLRVFIVEGPRLVERDAYLAEGSPIQAKFVGCDVVNGLGAGPGATIVAFQEAERNPDAEGRGALLPSGGIVTLRCVREPGAPAPRLVEDPTLVDLAGGVSLRRHEIGDFWGDDEPEIAALSQDARTTERILIYVPRPPPERFWKWAFLFDGHAGTDAAFCSVQADGDACRELLWMRGAAALLLDLPCRER